MTSLEVEARPSGIQVLDRAAALLKLLADSDTPLRVQELAERSGLVASTTRRILVSLCDNGLCEHTGGAYRLGIRLFELGTRVESGFDLRSVSRAPLQQLCAVTHLTTCLWVRYDDRAVVIDRFDGDFAFSGAPVVGMAQPLHDQAAPRVLLAWDTDDEIGRHLDLYRQRGELDGPSDHVLTALAEAADRGFAATSDSTSGIFQLAMPVFGHEDPNRPVAAISIAGLLPHFLKEGEDRLVTLLREAADSISRRLGHGLSHSSSR